MSAKETKTPSTSPDIMGLTDQEHCTLCLEDQILAVNQGDSHDLKPAKTVFQWLDFNLEKVLCSILMMVLILLLSYESIGRYIAVSIMHLNPDLSWTEELARAVFIWLTYLAVPLSIRNRDLIRVDAAVGKLPQIWQKRVWAASDLFFFILGAAIFFYGTKHINTLMMFPQTTPAMGISYATFYLILPIGFALILIRLAQDLKALAQETSVKDIFIGFALGLVILLPALLKIQLGSIVYLFGYFVITLVMGVPIAICLGFSALVTMYASATLPISYIATQAYTAIDSVTIICIPLFVAAGVFMGEGGLSKRLLTMCDAMLGRLPGGFGMATVLCCMLFAAMSGSGPATVAAIGTLTIPAMIERGYDKHFSVALVAAAGTIGVLIPPSNPFVVYGVSSSTSITKLFEAGITSGLLVGLVLMLFTFYMAKKHGWRGESHENHWQLVGKTTWQAKWALIVIVIILGGIYSGLCTPTEAAAIAALYSLLVGIFGYKGITKKNIVPVLVDSSNSSCIIILLMAMATIFGNIMTLENIPNMVAQAILGISSNVYVILLVINVMLLIVGMFMEALAAIVILTPLLLPIVTSLGVDPVHFGVIIVLNLAIGMITPPVGINLFVGSSVSKLRLEDIVKAVLPMLALSIVVLLLVTYIPALSMWLPNLLN